MKRKWLVGILRYGLGLLIALLIFWGFYGFIKDDNWLAVSALATLILAIAAFWAIRQNYNFRRQEKKERLLNEIIEWAEDISKCGIDAGIDFFRRYPTKVFDNEEDFIKDNDNFERKETEHRYWSRLLSEYLHLSKESGYIKIITTKKIKKEALDTSINKLVDELENLIKVIRQGLTGSANITTTMINVQRDEVKKCLDSVIDTATNLMDEITQPKLLCKPL